METFTSSLVVRANSLYDTSRSKNLRSEFREELEVDPDKNNSARKLLSHSVGPQEKENLFLWY
jgi:hypothetical protein